MTQQIGQYRVLSELGAGGMGVVYRAMDLLLEREVAIKRLRSEYAASPSVLERFRKEAQLQAKLNHPNIAQLYTLLQDGDSLCIVMEFIDGTVLRNFMPMPWPSAVPVVLQILEALDYAHRRGVLHRDIKPENIVIDREGTVKVMDFGIAHALGAARLTRERVVIGTLEYMPPERILNRDMDQRSDLYSVGVLLFEMLCGRLPFVERQRVRAAARPGGGRSRRRSANSSPGFRNSCRKRFDRRSKRIRAIAFRRAATWLLSCAMVRRLRASSYSRYRRCSRSSRGRQPAPRPRRSRTGASASTG